MDAGSFPEATSREPGFHWPHLSLGWHCLGRILIAISGLFVVLRCPGLGELREPCKGVSVRPVCTVAMPEGSRTAWTGAQEVEALPQAWPLGILAQERAFPHPGPGELLLHLLWDELP